ncbi:L-threonylcarbamoyladenylate synthase [Leucobacter sp. OH1287]|uniref:L-threonylcarbamoyladenylate synthase n=1 Tax=Leucobacter sp. OH1287 TaxID=2491049 RepID=UPI000F5EDFEB|nr:L-threonylcarbamoyladenylate synthase [Leucobacter sp. OH1287]RRD60629.1 threonylcarbamoyl-AMP synthase [Leucobacter sp. OH1287]
MAEHFDGSEYFDCSDSSQLLAASRAARQALGRGELVVLPTDTVYGVGADAFDSAAVAKLLAAKGRGRTSPPPVLIPGTATMQALAAEVTQPVKKLADAFWPGPLTMVMFAQPSLVWDLGETQGTVALRIPNHPLTLELLRETGPLAVSSANITGQPAAKSAIEAQRMLTDSVAVYLDAGEVSGEGTPSTILDVTELNSPTGKLRVLRLGAISVAEITAVLPDAEVITEE